MAAQPENVSNGVKPNTLKRLYYSAAWRNRTVPFVLARDPLCVLALSCEGTAPSTDVDHKIRAEEYIAMHEGDETFFFDPENLQGACHACHSRKTQLENKGLWHCNLIEGDMGSNL